MRAAIVAGKDRALVEKKRNVLAAKLYRNTPRALEAIKFACAGPLGRRGS
jgi:hypothetical protein